MKSSLFALLLGAAATLAGAASAPGMVAPDRPSAAAAAQELKAPGMAATPRALAPLGAAAKRAAEESLEPHQFGISRRGEVEAAARIDESSLAWRPAAGGMVAQVRVQAPGAAGLRVGLRLERFPKHLEIRTAQPGADGTMQVVGMTDAAQLGKLARGRLPFEYWTPSTEGEVQLIEFWTRLPEGPAQMRFRVFDLSHLLRSAGLALLPKLLSCHVDATCVADAAVVNQRRAVARMAFVNDGRSFVCTGTLLNDQASSGTPLFATAHHCISTEAAASTLETWWLFYANTCGSLNQAPTRVSGGAQLLVTLASSDFTLLQLNNGPPQGAMLLGWNSTPLTPGEAVYGLHHPAGSYQRYMGGTFTQRERVADSATRITFADLMLRVSVNRGILEGGSSGSGLFTTGGEFRGTLFGGPASNACGGGNTSGSYSDFSVVYPVVQRHLAGPGTADDAGDTAAAASASGPNARVAGEINTVADQDWVRFQFPEPGDFTVRSFDLVTGQSVDVAATLYAADGSTVIAASDDRQSGDLNFEVAARVTSPTTFYLAVRGMQGAVGKYGIKAELTPPDDHGSSSTNATALSTEGSASGFLGSATDEDWFRVAFDRAGTFEVRSTGATDVVGRIYAADGSSVLAENDDANPPDTNFGLSVAVQAGTVLFVRVVGFDGATGSYGVVASLRAVGERLPNYTDLWWNPSESGWGLNVNHQSDTLFATVFTYASDGAGMWLVASDLARQADGSYSGALYRVRGPVFNASNWGPVELSQVGTMRLAFPDANRGTLTYTVNGVSVTKSIERQPIAGAAPSCTFTVASRSGATNYQDLWWNPDESGWGINIAHQGSVIFATLFTYGADNRDMWLVASRLDRQADGSFQGVLYRTTGPAFNASPWPGVTLAEVGTMRLAFSAGHRGTLSYTVSGAAVTKTILRQVFAPRTSVCN